jgi:hypothetical protein
MKEPSSKKSLLDISLSGVFTGVACVPAIALQNIKVQIQKPNTNISMRDAIHLLNQDGGFLRYALGFTPFAKRMVGTGIMGGTGISLTSD